MAIATEGIKEIRDLTGAGVLDIKEALDAASGDVEKALKALKAKGAKIAAKKAGRATSQGIVEVYAHMDRIGAMVEVNCETDFVARNPEFKELAHDLALQAASLDSDSIDDLIKMPLVKDPSKTVSDLLTEKIAKLGENIKVRRFQRFVLGE